jgi:hypothetical protein
MSRSNLASQSFINEAKSNLFPVHIFPRRIPYVEIVLMQGQSIQGKPTQKNSSCRPYQEIPVLSGEKLEQTVEEK